MRPRTKSVALGLVAITLWSWSFALSRSLAEQLGVVLQPAVRDGGTVAAPPDAGTTTDGIRIRRRDAQ